MNYSFQDKRGLVGHHELQEDNNNHVEVRDSKSGTTLANPSDIGEHDVLCGRGGLSNAHGKYIGGNSFDHGCCKAFINNIISPCMLFFSIDSFLQLVTRSSELL